MSVIRSFIFFNIKYKYNITLILRLIICHVHRQIRFMWDIYTSSVKLLTCMMSFVSGLETFDS